MPRIFHQNMRAFGGRSNQRNFAYGVTIDAPQGITVAEDTRGLAYIAGMMNGAPIIIGNPYDGNAEIHVQTRVQHCSDHARVSLNY